MGNQNLGVVALGETVTGRLPQFSGSDGNPGQVTGLSASLYTADGQTFIATVSLLEYNAALCCYPFSVVIPDGTDAGIYEVMVDSGTTAVGGLSVVGAEGPQLEVSEYNVNHGLSPEGFFVLNVNHGYNNPYYFVSVDDNFPSFTGHYNGSGGDAYYSIYWNGTNWVFDNTTTIELGPTTKGDPRGTYASGTVVTGIQVYTDATTAVSNQFGFLLTLVAGTNAIYAGTYYYAGWHNGKPYWYLPSTLQFAFWNGSAWKLWGNFSPGISFAPTSNNGINWNDGAGTTWTSPNINLIVVPQPSATDSSGNALATATSLASLIAKFTGITFLAKWLGLIAGNAEDTDTLAEMQAQAPAAATYDNTTMSEEALATGGSAPTLAQIKNTILGGDQTPINTTTGKVTTSNPTNVIQVDGPIVVNQ